MLADLSGFPDSRERRKIAKLMTEVLSDATRETDIKGWHTEDQILGVLFTEMGGRQTSLSMMPGCVIDKCLERLSLHLGTEMLRCVKLTWHLFPTQLPERNADRQSDLNTEPFVVERARRRRVDLFARQVMNVITSLFTFTLFVSVFV
jgi:hypothetical protein